MKTKFTLTLLGIGLCFISYAQNEECLKDFSYLINKIRTDYPGYYDKVTKSTEKDLADLEMKLRQKIQEHPDSCLVYLDTYASWFRDNHMYVGNKKDKEKDQPAPTSAAKPTPEFLHVSDGMLADLGKKNGSVEGIWVSFKGRIAISKVEGENRYTGTAINYYQCEPNQLLFELDPINDTVFTMKKFPEWNDYKPVKGKASLHLNERVFEMHKDTRFVRQSASSTFDNALLNSYQPQFPNGTNIYPLTTALDDSTYYVRITNFWDDSGDKRVKAHWQEIMARPNLIIDIRGNQGGQDDFFQVLLSLLYTNPYPSKGVQWFASEGNIRFFEESVKNGEVNNGEEGIKWINELLGAMKKNPGGFVYHPSMGHDGIVTEDTVYKYPKRVGIIINDANASSAEQFILEAKGSKKVTLFGNSNTAGVLDYSNRVNEDTPSGKYEFYWPLTRSGRLPEHPIDNTGIPPDVIIPYPESKQLFDRLDDWAYFVKEYLELMNERH